MSAVAAAAAARVRFGRIQDIRTLFGTFEFDSEAFWLLVEEQAAELVKARAAELTEALAGLRKTHGGLPVAEVKDGLTAIFEGVGGSIADPELTEYATA